MMQRPLLRQTACLEPENSDVDGTVSFEICDRRYYCDPDKAIDDIVSWMKKNTHELGDVLEEI